jgi:hypothetical protein
LEMPFYACLEPAAPDARGYSLTAPVSPDT